MKKIKVIGWMWILLGFLLAGGATFSVYSVVCVFTDAAAANRRNQAKVAALVNLPEAELQWLIAESRKLRAEKLKDGTGMFLMGRSNERPIPKQFEKFEFIVLRIEDSKLVGMLYRDFDSSGDLVVDLNDSGNPTIQIVEGDYGEKVTLVYPKKNTEPYEGGNSE